jgi:hypothetical protein
MALLAAAGAVDTVKWIRARAWTALAWRLGALAIPAAIVAWVPTAESMTPGRWALFYVKMFTSYESAGRLDEALDAIDDGRALDPRTARAYETSLAGFVAAPQRQRIAAAVDKRIAEERARPPGADPVRLARWLRLLPDDPARADSRRVLEAALRGRPDDRLRGRLHRELGAWWLGQWREPGARLRARDELRLAASGPDADPDALLMLALLTGDAQLLNAQALASSDIRRRPRDRMARAAVAAHVPPR